MSAKNLADERIGMEGLSVQGETIRIVSYLDSLHVRVEFPNGTQKDTTWQQFKDGAVSSNNARTKKQVMAEYIGMEKVMSNGQTCRILSYRNSKDITVMFVEDGTILEHRALGAFKNGFIANPNFVKPNAPEKRIGAAGFSSTGEPIKIVAYKDSAHVCVEFPDGTQKETTWKDFKDGRVTNPYMTKNQLSAQKTKRERIGTKSWNEKAGLWMECVKYDSYSHITARFSDGYEGTTSWPNFMKGTVAHPNTGRQCNGMRYTGMHVTHKATGMDMECIRYYDRKNVRVRFSDGYENDTSLHAFLDGTCLYRGMRTENAKNWLKYEGKVFDTPRGRVKILRYRTATDYDAEYCGTGENRTVTGMHITVFLGKSEKRSYMQDKTYENMQGLRFRAKPGGTDSDGRALTLITFEDGAQSLRREHGIAKLKMAAHPALTAVSSNNIHADKNRAFVGSVGISDIAYIHNGEYNFFCTCAKCGKRDIMTAKEAREHVCEEEMEN